MQIKKLTLSIAALAAVMPAIADDVLQRCRAVTDGTARLACYDALADSDRARPAATRVEQPANSGIAAQRTAGEVAFGLPESRRPGAVEAVESSVSATFSGWGPNSRIRLANGQVWQVIDGTSAVLSEGARKVSVKRGALSSFYLDIDGLNTSPRVRRVE